MNRISLNFCATVAFTVATANTSAAVIDFQQNPPYVGGATISGKSDPNAGNAWAGFIGGTVGFDPPFASATEFWWASPAVAAAGQERITFTSTALGGSDASAGTYDFAFDIRRAEPGASTTSGLTAFTRVNTVRIGNGVGGSPVRIDILSNGLIQFFAGSTALSVTNDGLPSTATGSRFDLDSGAFDNTFVTLEGRIDFDTETFTLSVNGVDQNSGNAIAFNGGTGRSDTDVIGTFAIEGFTASEYRRIAVDNITLAIPEPGSVALAGLGGLAMLRLRR